jgi:hypothetical protein
MTGYYRGTWWLGISCRWVCAGSLPRDGIQDDLIEIGSDPVQHRPNSFLPSLGLRVLFGIWELQNQNSTVNLIYPIII